MSSVDAIHDRLSAWFVARGSDVVPEFGEAELKTHSERYTKVVVVPGGPDPQRDLGKLSQPERMGGGVERCVASLDELFRVYIAAYDANDPLNTKAQYKATRDLFDLVFAGVFSSFRNVLPVSCSWVVASVAAPFGAALMLVATARDSIFDRAEEDESTSVAPREPAINATLRAPSAEEEI